jgi:hypothetical protein
VLWAVKEKAKPGGTPTARQRARNHRFGKVRYRGIDSEIGTVGAQHQILKTMKKSPLQLVAPATEKRTVVPPGRKPNAERAPGSISLAGDGTESRWTTLSGS